MARSSYSVVAITINSLPCSIAPLHGSINERELSLAIYAQGKNISRKSCTHENIFTLNFLSIKYFLLKDFRTTVYPYVHASIHTYTCIHIDIHTVFIHIEAWASIFYKQF